MARLGIYLNQKLAAQLDRLSRKTGTPRSALVREAIKELLAQRGNRQWPPEAMRFTGVKGSVRFEEQRYERNSESES